METMTFRWWIVYDGFPFWVIDMESKIITPGQFAQRPRAASVPNTGRSRIAQLLAKSR